MGSSGSDGWRSVRHWFSQTPSMRLANASARSRTDPSDRLQVEVRDGIGQDQLQP